MAKTSRPAGTSGVLVTLNGDPTELPAPCSVSDLVARLGVRGRYAVEINGEIVPRGEHPERRVESGDRIEVVRAIGGG